MPRSRSAVPTVVLAAVAVTALAGPAQAAPRRPGFSLQRPSFTTHYARWNPCTPIHWRLDADLAPPTALRDTQGAIDRISAASGIRFVYDGPTSTVPGGTTGAADAPLVIAWARPGHGPGASDLLDGVEAGVGGWRLAGTPAGSGPGWSIRIVSAFVVVDVARAATLHPGFGSGPSTGALLLHELGHAMGLGHVHDPRQVMFDSLTGRRAELGAGDRAGLRAVGRPAGCIA